jgi:hypothetical protein
MNCSSNVADNMPPKWSAPERAIYALHVLDRIGFAALPASQRQDMGAYWWFRQSFSTYHFPAWNVVGDRLCSVFEMYFNNGLTKVPNSSLYGSLVLQELFFPCCDKIPGIGDSSEFHDTEVFKLYRDFFHDLTRGHL